MSASVQKIENEEQYEAAVAKIEELWESPEGTPERVALTTLIDLVHEYEGMAADLLTAEERN